MSLTCKNTVGLTILSYNADSKVKLNIFLTTKIATLCISETIALDKFNEPKTIFKEHFL